MSAGRWVCMAMWAAVLCWCMAFAAAEVKSPEPDRLLEMGDGSERMQGERSSNVLFRSPAGSFTARSRQFSEELVWFKPLLEPRGVAFSPDGQFLASQIVGNRVGIFRVSDGSAVRVLSRHTNTVSSVSFSNDGSMLASGSLDKTIKIWRVADGSLIRTLTGHTDWVNSVSFSPDGSLIASGSVDRTVKIWNASDGSLVRSLGHEGSVYSVTFSPDGSLLASGGSDLTIKIWRVSDGSLLRTLGHGSWVYSVSFSPDGSLIASGGGNTLKIWRVSDGSSVRTLTGHTDVVHSVAFSPDGGSIASGSWDKTVKIWRVSDGSLVRTLTGHTHYVFAVTFSPDGSLVASGSLDRTVRIWGTSDGSLVKALEGHLLPVTSVASSPDGSLIASGSDDSTLKIWRVSDGTLVGTLRHESPVNSVAFSPDGGLIASGGFDSTIKIWRVSDASLVRTLTGHTWEVSAVAFSPDGSLLASGSRDNTIKIWSMSDGSLIGTLTGHTSWVSSVSFSPDGSLIASGSRDRSIKIWRVSDGSLMRTLEGHTWAVSAVTFSPDGSLIASAGSEDRTIKIWRVSDGSLVRTLTGHPGYVFSVSFSANGSLVASGSSDKTIKIWRVTDGSLVRTLEGHTDWVNSVSFSPDGSLIASGGNDGVALWRIGAPTNRPPSAPTLLSPEDNSTLTVLPIQLKLSATDPDGQRLRFKIEISQNGQVVQTFDQTKDTSSWDKTSYASGETAKLTISQLPSGTYRWRAYAFDGFDWSGVSEVRSFTLERQIQWTFYEPIGYVVQMPIFRFKAEVPDSGSAQQLQFRIEVSPDHLFQHSVIVFDSASTLGWSKRRYASGEIAGFVAPYAFPFYRTLYWRARLRMPDWSEWSEPSPAQTFQVIRGFSIELPSFIRTGRMDRIGIAVTNPSPIPTEFILSFEIGLNTDDFGGTARLLDGSGTILDEIAVSKETNLLQFITSPLPQGVHYFYVEIQVQPTRSQSMQSSRIVPALGIVASIVVGTAVSMVTEWACKQAAKAFLHEEHDFNDEETGIIQDVVDEVSEEIVAQEVGKRAITQSVAESLERRGRSDLAEKLLKKVGKKGIPFAGAFFTLMDCAEGIGEAVKPPSPPPTPPRPPRPYRVEPPNLPLRWSWDPNMKVGVIGREGFIQPWEPLPYRVLFENLPEATAAAQEVIITDVLDEEIDLSTFSFTGVGFGARTFSVPVGSRTLSLDVDLRSEGKNMVVQIRGGLDEASRTVTVTFRGIDPDTGQLHPEGFLPPNQNPPEGEGWVGFDVRLKEDVQSGAVVKNKATIVFDVNPPIETNEVVVTVDKEPPQSRVTHITGSRAGRQVPPSAGDGRCVDCGVQNQGNVEVHFEADDDVSGIDTVALWASESKVSFRVSRQVIIGDRQYRHHSTVSGTAEAKMFKFRGKFGYNYRFYTVARDIAGNREAEPDDSDARITIGDPPTLPAGLHLVSVPVESEDADPKPVFLFEGNRWARWDPEAQSGRGDYVLYENDPTGFTRFAEPKGVPGRGYWVLLGQPTQVQIYGELPDETKPFVIPLKRGWNMIGNPWLDSLGWDLSGFKVRRGAEERTLTQAREAGWMEDYAWAWQPDPNIPSAGRYRVVYDPNRLPGAVARLEPWQGCWVYAYQDCDLVLPPLQAGSRAAVTRQAGGLRGGWTLRLHARAGDATGEVLLGGTKENRDIAIGLPPAPPVGGMPLRMVTRKGGVPLAVDVRAEGRSNHSWEIEVEVPPVDSDTATLWWGDVHRAPRQVNPVLVDLQTGERKFLRHNSSHTFAVSREGGTYKFRVELLPQSQLLRITNVRISGGRSHGSYTVSFSINAGAQVEVKVLSAGKVVRQLVNTVTRSAGIQQVSWDGRDSAGVAVPAGAYLVEIKSTSVDGQVTRHTVPLVVTR